MTEERVMLSVPLSTVRLVEANAAFGLPAYRRYYVWLGMAVRVEAASVEVQVYGLWGGGDGRAVLRRKNGGVA